MKKIALLILMTWSVAAISQEKLDIAGKVKISTMDVSDSDSIVVWNSDGTLARREATTLSELQVLSISNDTIYLSGGEFVKLPAEVDGSTTNEKITGFGIVGDSLYIKEGDMDTMKVSIVRQSSALNVIILNALANKNESFTSDSTGTVMDKDGNVYTTVKKGSQWWMAENLRTTRYSDGSAIDSANSDTRWTAANPNGKWCWYKGDSTMYGVPYGKLYNWYAVDDSRGLCPSGWHVPSDDVTGGDSEWQTLVNYLSPDAGLKMKSTNGWNDFNSMSGNGDNTSGFSGLPGGLRYFSGTFDNVGGYGYWWSSSQDDTGSAWYRALLYIAGDVGRNYDGKEMGFSVRCLRD